MQLRRFNHAAVRVPGQGILAIGGCSGIEDWLADVDLLQLSDEDEDVISWRQMAPMLQPKKRPSACHFRGFVFVCSRDSDDLDLCSFDVAAGVAGQWTRIVCPFRYAGWRHLLPLKGSLWIIGNLNAPFI